MKCDCTAKILVHVSLQTIDGQSLMFSSEGEPSSIQGGNSEDKIALTIHSKHTGHKEGSSGDLLWLPTHPTVVQAIAHYARSGVSRRAMYNLVHNVGSKVVKELGLEVQSDLDARFFPSGRRISNLVDATERSLRLDNVDQNAVEKLADALNKENTKNCIFQRSSGMDGRRALFVYQSDFQKHMMQRYGDVLCCLNATYKTNKYGYPLFLVVVITNHMHGMPVGMFFVEEETTEMITTALAALAHWNPNWKPMYWMIDKSDQESNAISNNFPESHILLCDFHRLQAWYRWLSKKDNLAHPAERVRTVAFNFLAFLLLCFALLCCAVPCCAVLCCALFWSWFCFCFFFCFALLWHHFLYCAMLCCGFFGLALLYFALCCLSLFTLGISNMLICWHIGCFVLGTPFPSLASCFKHYACVCTGEYICHRNCIMDHCINRYITFILTMLSFH